jgi:hypothetical protein
MPSYDTITVIELQNNSKVLSETMGMNTYRRSSDHPGYATGHVFKRSTKLLKGYVERG